LKPIIAYKDFVADLKRSFKSAQAELHTLLVLERKIRNKKSDKVFACPKEGAKYNF